MRKFLLLLFFCFLVSSAHSQLQPQPNEQCNWRGNKVCPIQSSGSSSICDATNPELISPGIYGIRICVSETPKFIGTKLQIGLALFGQILTVDVIPTEPEAQNNENCSNGQQSIGLRVFSAYCQLTGPGKIRGYWAVTYKLPSEISTQ